jgi:histidinol-phosphate aminotransferase
MLTRRSFARLSLAAAGTYPWTEYAFAQRALVGGQLPSDTVFLNANENPEGPGQAAIQAMLDVLPTTGRYHYQEFGDFYATVARSEGLERDQVLVGAGSAEILHATLDAFLEPTKPLIYLEPTYEQPMNVAKAMGCKLIPVRETENNTADVKRMVAEAETARGGVIYLCNPNNPTSAITPKADMQWLVSNLPPDTIALIDEAYFHFSNSPQLESAIRYVREGKSVVVTRTFSKIYGMAGLRAGFGIARPDLISKMTPFRNNVISIVAARAVIAALNDAPNEIPRRRERLSKIRSGVCAFLKERDIAYIDPHANFVMIDVRRDVRSFIPEMVARGVAPGRPFPPLTNMLRVSIGSESDMEKFKRVFAEVYKA